MRGIRIFVHCSASEFGTAIIIDQWHREKGWSGIGYQAVIENGFPTFDHYRAGHRVKLFNGMITSGRPIDSDDDIEGAEVGAHAYGHNKNTVAMCLIGDKTFTKQQMISAVKLVRLWQMQFKLDITRENIASIVIGHGELEGVDKTCPNIDMNVFRKLVINKIESFDLMRSMHNVKEVY